MPYRKHLFRTFLLFPFPLFQNLTELNEVVPDTASSSNKLATMADVNAKSSLSAEVDISSYTSSNPFICPNDGYIIAVCTAGQRGYVEVQSSANSNLMYVGAYDASGHFPVFVKKGMKAYPMNDGPGQSLYKELI